MSNTIVLKGMPRHDEIIAGAAFKPGHLVEVYNDAGTAKVRKHSTSGGNAERLFAKEDALWGKTINTEYTVGSLASIAICQPGDEVQARLPAAAAAIVIGDRLISNGDGTLIKPASLGSHTLFAATAPGAVVEPADTNPITLGVTHTIPANFLQVGDILHIKGSVLVPTATNSTNTLTFTLKIGSVTIVATAAVDAAQNDIAVFDAHVHVRAIGATGSILAMGTRTLGTPGTATALPFYLAPTTLNTTIDNAVDITITASAAHSDNEGQLTDLVVELSRVAPSELLCMALEAVDNSLGAEEAFIHVRCLN